MYFTLDKVLKIVVVTTLLGVPLSLNTFTASNEKGRL